jgi:hypothetical protein
MLSHPEYLHVLLNPLPVYGLSMGVVALACAFFLRNRAARMVALTIILVSSASAWPVLLYGEKAYDAVMPIADADGAEWMDAHQARAEKAIAIFYLVAALSLAALLFPRWWPKTDLPLAITTMILALATLAAGAWIAYAGGRIRHEEFRAEPPPAAR